MTFPTRTFQQIILALAAGIVLGCVLGSFIIAALIVPSMITAALMPPPTPTRTFTPTATATTTATAPPTLTFTLTPPPTPTSTATSPTTVTSATTATILAPTATRAATITATPTRTPRPIAQHFIVGRPVAQTAQVTVPDPTYLYGTTRFNDLDVHHGEEFENPIGTPLYAVADGTVVTAGSDDQPICGNDGKSVCGRSLESSGFYGKLIVIQLSRLFNGQRVFALYGHLNQINVSKGDQVKQGDAIGNIGMSGIALGPHVHFEIRLDVNDYAHTRNPILWMTPLPGRGSLAGRYLDAKGNPVRGAIVNIFRADNNVFLFSTETYGNDKWPDVNSDDSLGENFAMGDLPAGDYTIHVSGQPFAARVAVQEGKLSFVEIGAP